MREATESKKITVVHCTRWSSSFTRKLATAGRRASASAIRDAAQKGVPVSYINKDGKLVTEQVSVVESK